MQKLAPRASRTEAPRAAEQSERLLTHREVSSLLGLSCKSSHVVRDYARRGLIEVVRINARVLRFKQSSVQKLISGLAS